MNGNDVATFLGVSVGNWLQWGAGFAFTLVNFWILGSRYKRSHSEKLIERISYQFPKETKGGTGIYTGLQISVLNVGSPTKVLFVGFTRRYWKRRWKIIQFIKKAPILWDLKRIKNLQSVPNGVDERVHNLEDFIDSLSTDNFYPLPTMDSNYTVQFNNDELEHTILELVKNESRLKRKVQCNRSIMFDANFITFDGHVKQIKLRLLNDEEIYKHIKEKVN